MILPWINRPYKYVKRQRIRDPRAWVRVLDTRANAPVGSIGSGAGDDLPARD